MKTPTDTSTTARTNASPALPRGTAADLLATKGSVVYGVGPQETVYEAILQMSEKRVGALVVMDGARMVGILSERDYARKVILLGRASRDTPVADIMSAPVITATPQTPLAQCMEVVSRHQIRHLPIVDGDAVVGIISINDLVRAIVEQQAETIQSLNAFIAGDYPA